MKADILVDGLEISISEKTRLKPTPMIEIGGRPTMWHIMNLDSSIYATITQPMLNHINVGFESDVSIFEAAQSVAKTVGYQGDIVTDPSRPDGTPRKLMDSTRLNALGWTPKTKLMDGLALAYRNFIETHTND